MINRTHFRLSSLILCLLLPLLATANYGPRDFGDAEPMTAIVAAYEPEIEAINAALEVHPEADITEKLFFRGVEYQIGHYKGEPVVIFSTGVSIPNAAMTVQMAIDYFPVERLIMMGIAGAVNPIYEPGDITVCERWYYHDESVYLNPDPDKEGEFILPDYYENTLERLAKRGEIDPHSPKYDNFGYIHPDDVSVIKEGWDTPRQMPYFTATPSLIEAAKDAVVAIGEIKMTSGTPIQITVGGNGITGSVFLDNAEYRKWSRDVFNAEVTEMESAAVAQVCFINEVDWVIIRSVSDLAGGQVGKNEENVFDDIASETGTQLLLALLDEVVEDEE